MARTYHIALLKDGNRLIVEAARTVDQLSCEAWKYYGERITTVADLRRKASTILAAVNTEHGTAFQFISVHSTGRDYSAGH